MSPGVTACIVLYHHNVKVVAPLFAELARDPQLLAWAVVDNGGSSDACDLAASLGAKTLAPDRNLGFGAAHNLGLRSLAETNAPYHLIVNPDIIMKAGILTPLAKVMDAMPDVGMVMPRVLNPDGSVQNLCKLLPAPIDLILRRFASRTLQSLFRNRMARYDMRCFDSAQPVCVPVLSGCFMFTRRSVLEAVGGFDERFFLYMEDVDLCRRMGAESRLLLWPSVTVTHGHSQGSYKHAPLLWLHTRSAIAYFNKWGWFFDPSRDSRNQIGLEEVDMAELPLAAQPDIPMGNT